MSVLGKNCGWVQICVAGIPTFASELQTVVRIVAASSPLKALRMPIRPNVRKCSGLISFSSGSDNSGLCKYMQRVAYYAAPPYDATSADQQAQRDNLEMALRHVVLTVLARGDMTGYEITRTFATVYSQFWRASHQQVYRELGRLSTEGRVNAKVVVQEGKPDKKIYSLTKRGLEELRQWVSASTEVPRSQNDLLVKLLGCGIVGREAFRPELDRIRSIAAEWLTALRKMRRECVRQREKGWTEYEQVLYLALRRGVLLGEAQMRWLDEVDVYLRSGKLPRGT